MQIRRKDAERHKETSHTRLWQGVLVVVGAATFGMGTVGLFLPVIPTTPFYLVSGWCWLRGSKRLHAWLMGHPVFGSPLRDYFERRGVRRRNRFIALLFLWLGLGLSIWLTGSLHLRILLIAVGVAVSAHLVCLKALDPPDDPKP